MRVCTRARVLPTDIQNITMMPNFRSQSLLLLLLVVVVLGLFAWKTNNNDNNDYYYYYWNAWKSTASFLRLGRGGGVDFSWQIGLLPSLSSFVLRFDGNHCSNHNDNGDNNCHYNWGESVTGSYELVVAEPIDVGDQMTGHLKVTKQKKKERECSVAVDLCVCVFVFVFANTRLSFSLYIHF